MLMLIFDTEDFDNAATEYVCLQETVVMRIGPR